MHSQPTLFATFRFFDYSKMTAKRAFRVIQVCLHLILLNLSPSFRTQNYVTKKTVSLVMNRIHTMCVQYRFILLESFFQLVICFSVLIVNEKKTAYELVLSDDIIQRLDFDEVHVQIITGTDHPIPHLYDINSFQCYLSANAPEIDVNGAINQVLLTLSLLIALMICFPV